MKQAVTNVCFALSDDEDYVSFDEEDLNAGIQDLYGPASGDDAGSDISNEEYFDAAPTAPNEEHFDLLFTHDPAPIPNIVPSVPAPPQPRNASCYLPNIRSFEPSQATSSVRAQISFTPPPPPRGVEHPPAPMDDMLMLPTHAPHANRNRNNNSRDRSNSTPKRRRHSAASGRGGRNRRSPQERSRRSLVASTDDDLFRSTQLLKPRRTKALNSNTNTASNNDLFESLCFAPEFAPSHDKARASLNIHNARQSNPYRSGSAHSHLFAPNYSPSPMAPMVPNPFLSSFSPLTNPLRPDAEPFVPQVSPPRHAPPRPCAQTVPAMRSKTHKLSKRIDRLNEMQERAKRKDRKIIHKQRINANVISIELGTLKQSAQNIATGDPIRCTNKNCGAILSKYDTLVKEKEDMKLDDDDESIWTCRFCQTSNVIEIDDEEMPVDETVDYMIEPPDDDKASDEEEDEKQIIFCIDISGSMCVTQPFLGKKINLKGNRLEKENEELSQFIDPMDRNQWMPNQSQNVTYISRLQSVQAAVDEQMERLKEENPNTAVGLVTFNSEVTVYGDGMSTHEVIAGDKLNDLDKLREIECIIQHKVKDNKLSDALWKLEEGGQTALGPALSVSIAMASIRRGSQVILCTDGLANVGIGNMDEADAEATSTFYQNIGAWAMQHGVIVSIISITDDGCNLEALGRIVEVTNGNLRRINPLNLTEKFSGILDAEIIATSTTATMWLHPGLKFVDTVTQLQNLNPFEDAVQPQDKEEEETVPSSQQDIGNVLDDTTIFFEYALNKKVIANHDFEDLKELPFQVHITYDKLDGTKMLRVITQEKEVTYNRDKVRENLDYAVLSQYGTRVTTKLCDVGDYEASRAFTNANTRYLHKNASSKRQMNNLANYVNNNIGLDFQMQQQQRQEISNYNQNKSYNNTFSPSMNNLNNNWIARGMQINSIHSMEDAPLPSSAATVPVMRSVSEAQRPQSVHFQSATPISQNLPQQSSRRAHRNDKFSSLQYGMKRKF
eukprot:337626_1